MLSRTENLGGDFAKNANEIKGGAIEGAVASKEEILALATLPNRERTSFYAPFCTKRQFATLRCQSTVADNKEDAA